MQFAIGSLHAVFVLYYEPASFCKGSSEWRNLYVTTSYYCRAYSAPLGGDGARGDGAAGPLKMRCHPISGAGSCLVWRGKPVYARRFMAGLLPGSNVPRLIV